jgi:hypothetical protein
MGQTFRNINYGRLLYESLRNYFSVNTANQISILYQYCACFLQPLIAPFAAYVAFRNTEALIAQCQWQIGQLTNVLNFLFDSLLQRIFITQSTITIISDPEFAYPAINFDGEFGETVQIWEREFFDPVTVSTVTINVPIGTDISAITAVINQIRIQGIPYLIATF